MGGGKGKVEVVLDADEYEEGNGFRPDTRKPAMELDGGDEDEKEYWLFQWPVDQPPDLTGQEVTLALDEKRQLGTFQGPSGKTYDIVKLSSGAPAATVYLSSPSGAKIVGGIMNCAAFVRYPEAEEIEKHFTSKKQSQLSSFSAVTSSSGHKAKNRSWRTNSKKSKASGTTSTPLQNSSKRTGSSGVTTSTHRHWEPKKPGSSGLTTPHSKSPRSLSPGLETPESPSKRVYDNQFTKDNGRSQSATPASTSKRVCGEHSSKDSGRGQSALTSSLGYPKKKSKIKM
ncbi:Mediator-associated protein 2-like protein [Drosera capensis]